MGYTAPQPLPTLIHLPTTTTTVHRRTAAHCGPRDNRPPLHKGRILSTEAILAIQSLKRTPSNSNLPILHRLLKSDLIAAIKELLRQDRCNLAAKAFSVLKSEYGADLSAYAEMVAALHRNGLVEEIDPLIRDLEADGGIQEGDGGGKKKGLLALVKAVIRAERKESTVRIYAMMKERKMEKEMDEYLGRVLSKGLRRFGAGGLADEVDLELGRLYRGIFVNSPTPHL